MMTSFTLFIVFYYQYIDFINFCDLKLTFHILLKMSKQHYKWPNVLYYLVICFKIKLIVMAHSGFYHSFDLRASTVLQANSCACFGVLRVYVSRII